MPPNRRTGIRCVNECNRLIASTAQRIGVTLALMIAFLKRTRWAALMAGYIVVATVCRLLRIALPMESFWRPHNLRRFRPYYVAPRTVCYFRAIPPRRGK